MKKLVFRARKTVEVDLSYGLRAIVFFCLMVGCSMASASKLRFEDIEKNPYSAEDLISEFVAMAVERCDRGLTASGRNGSECLQFLERRRKECDPKLIESMPARIEKREDAIEWAKNYHQCLNL